MVTETATDMIWNNRRHPCSQQDGIPKRFVLDTVFADDGQSYDDDEDDDDEDDDSS